MLAVIKNDFYRLFEQKGYLVISTLLTVSAVIAAIVLTNHVVVKENIALVTDGTLVESSPYLEIQTVKEVPEQSELIAGRYDAAVVMKQGKIVNIHSAKSKEETDKIKALLENPGAYEEYSGKERQVGTNIIGYIMMFLLMQGIIYGRFFGQEKEKHLSERIVTSPIGFYQYALGHGVFVFALIFLPTFLVILIGNLLGVSEGLSIASFAGTLIILSVFATSFSLFINSLFHESDTANMVGNAIIVFTTILSGSFVSMMKEGTVLAKILHVLPQKDFLAFVNDLEKNMLSRNSYLELIYVILITVVLLVAAVAKTKREYVCCH